MNDLIREGEGEHLGWFAEVLLVAVTPCLHSRYLNLLEITSATLLRLAWLWLCSYMRQCPSNSDSIDFVFHTAWKKQLISIVFAV